MSKINEENSIYVVKRDEWRNWLEANYRSAVEIWIIYPRKHSGKPRIPYNTAVEEALCFGWIDSITNSIDDDHYGQRFTPRKPKSSYSQTNVERLHRLIGQNKVISEILEIVTPILERPFIFPEDIKKALQENSTAWHNFQSYSGSYQRIRIAYVETARKRGAEFDKRLNNLIKKCEQNKQFGFGIEDYY
ncbi:MAG: YdeI/OmpD-associated family protein [Chloroflexota bacterium]